MQIRYEKIFPERWQHVTLSKRKLKQHGKVRKVCLISTSFKLSNHLFLPSFLQKLFPWVSLYSLIYLISEMNLFISYILAWNFIKMNFLKFSILAWAIPKRFQLALSTWLLQTISPDDSLFQLSVTLDIYCIG